MKIELSSIIENQFPTYVREEYPLAIEFLKQYYISNNGNKIVQNLEEYLDLDTFFNIVDKTVLSAPVDIVDDIIIVESTIGFPDSYGLLKINEEIITYTSKTQTTFEGCVRGFSGIDLIKQNQLNFTESVAVTHNTGDTVDNLSVLFLKIFFLKIKQKIAPGFDNREFFSGLNQSNFLKRINDFYSSKGTVESFRILFGALYGEDVKVILPRDYLFAASDADYRIVKKIVVESLEGNPFELINSSLYQDTDGFVPEARGTVTYVEKIIRGGKEYYSISLDFGYDRDINVSGTLKSDFSIHPKTITTNEIPSGSTFIDVDSTVGFPENGTLLVKTEDNEEIKVYYQSKTFNQFLDCSGINRTITNYSQVRYDTFAYGYSVNQELIKLRITGVLSDINFIGSNYLYKKNEKANIETLGVPSDKINLNTWKFNIPLIYNIDVIELEDQNNLIYKITTIDNHIFSIGDFISLIPILGQKISGNILSVLNNKIVIASLDNQISLETTYKIEKKISKVNFRNRPELNIYSSNIQNTFLDFEDNSYILSPSLPSYLNSELNPDVGKFTVSALFTGIDNNELEIENHRFYTGDSVVFKSSVDNSVVVDGVYYVKKVTDNIIKLATSRENIYGEKFLGFSNQSLNGTLEPFEFTNSNLSSKDILPQNLIRKLSPPTKVENKVDTVSGPVGIFNNGVEILNYKSPQQIFYGPIEEIVVAANGTDYDLLAPLSLIISHPTGTNAIAYPVVQGNLKRIDLIESGFDYLVEPEIFIRGGNGNNAKAKANLVEIEHIEQFNGSIGISTSMDTIGFSTYHKFRNSEQIIYNANSHPPIGGLTNNEKYFVNVKSPTIISLHSTFTDSVSGINSIIFTSMSIGDHLIKALEKKKIVSSISVINPGENYINRKNYISNITTSNSIITVKNHNFNEGEIVFYSTNGSVSTGLNNNTEYYVKVIDKNNVRLFAINSNGSPDYFYKVNNFVKISGVSTSPQYLSYPPITVEIKGRIGITTFSNEDYNAKTIPVFRGKIVDVTIENGGENYGSEEIIDYNNQPDFNIQKGSGAQLLPIISNGSIKEVIILSNGDNYISYPDLVVFGDGFNAILTPVIVNNKLQEVKVISGGFNYTPEKTSIIVSPPGQSVKFEARIKSWRINIFEKYNSFNYFQEDDGIILNSNNIDGGLEYYHLFAARKLRESTYIKKVVNETIIFEPDLVLDSLNREINSTNHSPILGWAYDGNPIYGPYGYSTRFGGSTIKQLESGYKLKTNSTLIDENRPSFSLYPQGLFVEDYEFDDSKDLDVHNGRYCSTPEFPNGVYAYFTTFENNVSGTNKYKFPKFPYVIGNSFHSNPIEFNLDPKSTQSIINLNELNLIRNTTPYNLNSINTFYESVILPYSFKKELLTITSISQNKIDEVLPVISGNSYKINDKIIISNENAAIVSAIKGKTITETSVDTQIIENIELLTKNKQIIGYCSSPHNLQNNTFINLSTYDKNNISQPVIIEQNNLILSQNVPLVSTTGIVTYFNVYGDLNEDTIRSNDVYSINDENLKIINVEKNNSRIKVIRSFNGTIGVNTHQAGILLTEISKKVIVNNQLNVTSKKVNTEIYFNPKESVSIGLSHGIGIVSTLFFNNPGLGESTLILPTRYIHLPNHKLELNDELTYNSYDDASISISTNGITTSNLTGINTLFAFPFDENNIGIASGPVAIGSTGSIINSINNTSLLYFAASGLGTFHSLTTKYFPLKADLIKNEVLITTNSNHNLNLNDEINLNHISGITTVIKFKYNNTLRRILSKESQILSVDIENNILSLPQHNFKDNEKVVYVNSGQNISGLQNNSIYYVIKINEYKIKLTETYDTNFIPIEINLQSLGNGSIFSINPSLEIVKNSTLEFDLSDTSLGYTKNTQKFPSFKFSLYYDSKFINEYYNDQNKPIQKFTQTGVIGDGLNAKVTLIVDEFTPQVLYYDFIALVNPDNPQVKLQKINDFDQIGNNSIIFSNSKLSNDYSVESFNNNTFKISTTKNNVTPLISSLDEINYDTKSLSATGGISKVKVTKNNSNNKELPEILEIETQNGQGAILIANSDKIGKINSIILDDVGFEYSSDTSLRPKVNLPKIIKVQPLFTIKNIEVINSGINYFIIPDLLLIDNLSQQPIPNVEFEFIPDKKILNVLKNTEKIEGTTPFIIPINNSSGVTINDIYFDSNTKDVTVILDQEFSSINDFPFENGDKVLIENVVVGEDETGFNSDLYNYALFEIENVDPKIGGVGASFTYNMSQYLNDEDVLGTYNTNFIKGTVTPEKYFPTFKINLERNQFILNENILNSDGLIGTIEDENFSNNYIKVLTNNNQIDRGSILTGQSSKVSVIVIDIIEFDAYLDVKSSAIVEEGWQKETGFFNNNQQRLHDNEYYQNFSYSLLSEVGISEWNEVVTNLNHPSGFKKFSDLIVYSESTEVSSIADSEIDNVNIIESDINMNCINNFDLVRENSFILNDKLSSNEIYFENVTNLQDYIEAIGNRVLSIDKAVINFSDENELKNYIILDSISTQNYYYKKYFISVLNKWYPEKSSIIIVTNLFNSDNTLINQYSDVSTKNSLGFFDSEINDNQVELRFLPDDFEYSSYYINHLSFNVGNEFIGVSTIGLGSVVNIEYSGITTASGIGTTTIFEFSSDVSAAKILLGIKEVDEDECEFTEITVLNSNNDIYYADYGNLTTSNSGLGSFAVYYNAGKVLIDFAPSQDFGNYSVNVVSTLINNTTITGVGSTVVDNNSIFSTEVTTDLGITTEIFRYPNENSGSYSVVYVENSTDSVVNEFVSLYNPILNDVNFVEFGNLATDNVLGIITSYVENNDIVTYFIPKDSSEYKIRTATNIVGTFQNKKKLFINESFNINSDFNFFEAALFGTKKEVEVLHQGLPVFRREFDGSSSAVVKVDNNTINIPNHYFMTGEEIEYSFEIEPISIASTITGVGVTDKLPKNVFAVRVNDNEIKIAAAASFALLPTPQTLDLQSVGVGTIHSFNARLQNNRSIILVDNLTQNPLGLTTTSTSITKNIGFYDSKISLNNINNIRSNELLKINDEIVKVISVGVGSTNICFVDRAKLGTTLAKHEQSDIVNKIICDYNIIKNKINFEANPFVTNVEDEYSYDLTFTGRIFLRSGILNGSNPTYYDNYIFDDLSDEFNGIKKSFTLKQGGNDLIDISQDNVFVTVNNIFQSPQINYGLQEIASVTNLNFVGDEIGSNYDVNTTTVPRGGIIVSVGSSQGFGYQPLVSAGGTAIVSAAGTIQSISIGNSGSGYRSQLQTVNVGIQTENNTNYNIQFIGTATVSNGNVIGVSITNPGIGYTNYPVKYDTLTTNEVAIGVSILPIEVISGINTNFLITVGTAITDAPIVGVGSTTIIINNSFVSSSVIAVGTTVIIKEFLPPIVIFDSPLSYSNLPLKYKNENSGVGTEATISLVIGQGSSVTDFEINNFGYGYKLNDELTVDFGGISGIPTDISKPFFPFTVTVTNIFNDAFSGIRVGQLEIFDPFDKFFNGLRKSFQLRISNTPKAINLQTTNTQKIFASDFNLANSLLIFINDVLQEPEVSYTFNKGSVVTFLEPPQAGDKSKVFFYRGTRDIDTIDVDVIEEIEEGDEIILNSDDIDFQQAPRKVFEVTSPDSLNTYLYSGYGISEDDTLLRPVDICRLTEDVIINGAIISKDRNYYESLINPTTRLISPVSLASTEIFVENLRGLFDNKNEYAIIEPQNKNIKIVSTGSSVNYEEIEAVVYDGDYGIISGIKTTSIGIGSTGIIFQFYIPQNSVLRKDNYVVNGLSGITTGYYFKVNSTNIGDGIISLETNEAVVGLGTTFIDNVYKVYSVSIAQTSVLGVGITDVVEVTSKVDRYVTGVGISGFYGNYSWGRIHSFIRKNPKEFEINSSGVSTAPIVQRIQSIKFENYSN